MRATPCPQASGAAPKLGARGVGGGDGDRQRLKQELGWVGTRQNCQSASLGGSSKRQAAPASRLTLPGFVGVGLGGETRVILWRSRAANTETLCQMAINGNQERVARGVNLKHRFCGSAGVAGLDAWLVLPSIGCASGMEFSSCPVAGSWCLCF